MTATKTPTRDAQRTRQAVLRAATQLFGARGFDGVSIGEIADAAGVSRATPLYFYTNKEGLWRAVLNAANLEALEVAPSAFARLNESADSSQLIEALVDSFLEFLERNPMFFRLVQWSELQGNGAINELPSQWDAIAAAVETVRGVLGRRGNTTQDPKQMVISIIALCSAHLVYGQILGTPLGVDVRDPAFLKTRAKHLKRLLVAVLT